jgi:hypothetical protein
MVQLPVMYGDYEAVTLGKNHPDEVNHGDLNQIGFAKKGKNTQSNY